MRCAAKAQKSPADARSAISALTLAAFRQIKGVLESAASGGAKERRAEGEARVAAAAAVVS